MEMKERIKELLNDIGPDIAMWIFMLILLGALIAGMIIYPTHEPIVDRFIELGYQCIDGQDCYILYDKETRVMYVSKGGTLTVMVDENGQPLLYDGNLETKENTK